MPTVLRDGPYRFFFYAGEGGEPPHIHVEHDDLEAKFWLDPVRLERSHGLGRKEIKRFAGWSSSTNRSCWRVGMSSSAVESREPFATKVDVSEDTLSVELADGRTISAPLAWYPRLERATAKERQAWRLIAGGRGIHWSALDEDISVGNLLAGQPSAESQSSFKKWLASRTTPSPGRRRPRASP